jgi:hypothetical protein
MAAQLAVLAIATIVILAFLSATNPPALVLVLVAVAGLIVVGISVARAKAGHGTPDDAGAGES